MGHGEGGSGPVGTSDGVLIEASLRDPRQFGGIFERHASAVGKFLAARCDPASVEDLVAETFVAAFRSRANFDTDRERARPWLLGIAVNVARHHRRAEGRRHARMRLLSNELATRTSGHGALDASEVVDAQLAGVRQALDRVHPRYREVLLLVGVAELTYEEVSETLGIPVGTVRSRLSRGRRLLRGLLSLPAGVELDGCDAVVPTTGRRTS